MSGGTYTLLIELGVAREIEVGALGTHRFDPGLYAYTGRALGPGGFSRVDRHRRLAAGEGDVRHWHIDYLLASPASTVRSAVRSPGLDAECAVARAIEGTAVHGFGASDCGCDSHLAFSDDPADLEASVRDAHDRPDE